MSFYETKRRGWRRSWSFIAATIGATLGLGNLWKFAYLAGENGGASFVVAYLVCVLLVAMPVMIAEIVLGSRGRANPVTTVQDISLEAGVWKGWQIIGWLGGLAGLLILSYYSVIAGWSFAYIAKLLGGEFLAGSAQLSGDIFNTFLSEPLVLIQWHTAFLLLVMLIVASGVRLGIGGIARLLVPLLFIAMVVLVVYSCRVGDAEAAVDFLFSTDDFVMTSDIFLDALGQAFFSLTIGVGAMIAYGAYVPDKRSIISMSVVVVGVDTVFSLLAGMAIFPLVFGLHMAPAMGPGLMFVAMPYGFGNMIYGSYFGALFFLLVALTAVTSGVALLEPATVWLSERFRLWRPVAALLMTIPVWLLGLLTIFSFNLWQDVSIHGFTVFGLLDFIAANILLPVGGVLVAVFVGWRIRREVLRDELYVEGETIFSLWHWVLRYIAAPGVLVVFLWSLYQALQ